MASNALLPLTIRLQSLTHQIYGSSTPTQIPTPIPTNQDTSRAKPILQRVQAISDLLDSVGQSSDGLKRLISGYETYLPLLHLPDPTIQTTTNTKQDPTSSQTQTQKQDQAQNTNRNESQSQDESIKAENLLPDPVKISMILSLSSQIQEVERDLREIELLRQRGVEGSGSLEDLLPFKKDLITGMKHAEKRSTAIRKARKEVSELLERYFEFTSTVSELFLELNRRMEVLEEGVGKIERGRRKELRERF